MESPEELKFDSTRKVKYKKGWFYIPVINEQGEAAELKISEEDMKKLRALYKLVNLEIVVIN